MNPMKYTSTRDRSLLVTFEEALCSGYAPDGGLFVPECLPEISSDTLLSQWSKLCYPELSFAVLRNLIAEAEIPDESLRRICQDAFVGFHVDSAVAVPVTQPLRGLEAAKNNNIYVAELWHGPTFCFKDLGMRIVILLLEYFAQKRKRPIRLVVSTTGDTGPAAARAVKDLNSEWLKLLVHYPAGQISNFQRKQLTTVAKGSDTVKVVAFEGGGDDMDKPIKNILASSSQDGSQTSSEDHSAATTTKPIYTGVNSYNIGRPVMQMVHFIWTYLRVLEHQNITTPDQLDSSSFVMDIILPTGAMGNIAGGYMAQKMCKLRCIRKFVAAVNANDIVHRAVQTGQFHRAPEMLKTLSEAINIQVPYNFERLLYYLTDGNDTQVKEWMKEMETSSKIDLDATWLTQMQATFGSARVTDEQMCAALQQTYYTCQYLIDPHTAVAVSAAQQLGFIDFEAIRKNNTNSNKNDDGKSVSATVIMSTASPCKFEEAVTAAVGSSVWEEYFENDETYPAAARELLLQPEEEPILYKALPGASLEENQVAWEQLVLEILQNF